MIVTELSLLKELSTNFPEFHLLGLLMPSYTMWFWTVLDKTWQLRQFQSENGVPTSHWEGRSTDCQFRALATKDGKCQSTAINSAATTVKQINQNTTWNVIQYTGGLLYLYLDANHIKMYPWMHRGGSAMAKACLLFRYIFKAWHVSACISLFCLHQVLNHTSRHTSLFLCTKQGP